MSLAGLDFAQYGSDPTHPTLLVRINGNDVVMDERHRAVLFMYNQV